MLVTLLTTLAKMFILTLVLTFESVLGAPVIFFTVLLALVQPSTVTVRTSLLLLSSLLLAVSYQVSLMQGSALILGSFAVFTLGGSLIKGTIMRLWLAALLMATLAAGTAGVIWTNTVLWYFLVSLAVSLLFLWRTLSVTPHLKLDLGWWGKS